MGFPSFFSQPVPSSHSGRVPLFETHRVFFHVLSSASVWLCTLAAVAASLAPDLAVAAARKSRRGLEAFVGAVLARRRERKGAVLSAGRDNPAFQGEDGGIARFESIRL